LQKIQWHWVSYSELTKAQLYASMVLRQQVFVVEQDCPYLDADNLDPQCWHLLGYDGSEPEAALSAYCRVVAPGIKYPERSIGRVLSASEVRGRGLGRELMKQVIECIDNQWGAQPLRISAQCYLSDFYSNFGFEPQSAPYQEDGIPHVEMLRP
jgi:ElaA protein